jgi:hypothetical protein
METTMTTKSTSTKKTTQGKAEIVREYTPVEQASVHGVTFDGKLVWFAIDNELVAFDPETEKVARRFKVAGASAGTAYDGHYIYQLAGADIAVVDPESGAVVKKLPAPGKGAGMSGMAYSDGYLWIGQYRDAKIHQVDVRTGAIHKTLSSDRFVTGVSCFGGVLWHGVSEEGPCELRRLAADGTVEEALTIDGAEHLAGVESTGDGSTFWCGGERGKLRLVRRKRGAAV